MATSGTTNSSVIPRETVLHMQHAFKLALSLALLYWLALSLNWDLPKYGALAIVLISLDTTGASLHKGMMRIVGTTVGLAVGLLGLALFAQDPWLTLAYHALYLVIVSYFMQSSRYPYAWFVAGFLPSLVWATTYGSIYNAFSYATFRYLETSAGVVIFTAVSIIFWPRQAGDQLNRQGHDVWQELQGLFGLYRRQLDDGQLPSDAPARQAKLAGTVAQVLTTLEAAYADTPSVAAQKNAWELFRVNTRAFADAMELWRQSIDDCRHLDLDRFMPQVHAALEKLSRRLDRIDVLWQARSAGEEVSDTDDHDESLLAWQKLAVSRDSAAELSAFDRAALLSFGQQFDLLHVISGQLLRTMRGLAGLSRASELASYSLPPDLYRPSRWDLARFVNGLLPAVCFIVAYVFWIYLDPPAGPTVPSQAATFALLVVLTPMNALVLIPMALVAIWFFLAPVYFLVMPRLSTGPELLTLVFVFAFVVDALLVGRRSPLKVMILALFVMMTGISNEQVYSFTALVDGAQMILLAVAIIAIVQTLMSPMKSERAMLKGIRGFFRGCARVTGRYDLVGPVALDAADQARGRRYRKRCLESMILPAPTKLQTVQKYLDYRLYPDNPPEKVQRLIDALQSIANRLQSLEIAHNHLAGECQEHPDSLAQVGACLRELKDLFDRWAGIERGAKVLGQHEELERLSDELKHSFDVLESDASVTSDQASADIYAFLGCLRGLIEAMGNAHMVLAQINWRQLAAPRF